MKRHWLAVAFTVPLLAQPARELRVDVNLVRVPCAVRDRNGAPAQGLRRDDFVVLDDGVPQPVKYVWQELDLPINVGLISDWSCILSGAQNPFRRSLAEFVTRVLAPEDRAFLVSAGRQQRLITDLTNSVEELLGGADGLGQQGAPILGEPCSGIDATARSRVAAPCGERTLWNSVFFSARLKLRPQTGRKALLLFTEGKDSGSDHGFSDAIEACQNADTVVYPIRYGWLNRGPRAMDIFTDIVSPPAIFLKRDPNPEGTKARRQLERIARETGGLEFEGEYLAQPDRLAAIFDRIESDLRSQHVVAYSVPAGHARGTYHRIRVKVRRPGASVRARLGYYAP